LVVSEGATSGGSTFGSMGSFVQLSHISALRRSKKFLVCILKFFSSKFGYH